MFKFYNTYGLDKCYIKDHQKLWYWCMLEMQLTSMFDYNINIDKKYIEHTLIRFGVCAIVKVDNEYFCGVPAIQPPLDNFGMGTTITITTYNGQHTIKGTIGVDCVLIWNNTEYISDFGLYWFVDMFNEVDKSMKANVINARLHPIPIAKNSKVKSAIDKIFSAIKGDNSEDKIYSVLAEQSFAEVVNKQNTNMIDVLNLTDVKNIDKLQYLSKFHDDLLRRFCTLYGQPMQTSGKLAQQTTEEIQGYNTFSMIYPTNRLSEREKGIKMFNNVFNENASVEFSEPWQIIFNREEVTNNEDKKQGNN